MIKSCSAGGKKDILLQNANHTAGCLLGLDVLTNMVRDPADSQTNKLTVISEGSKGLVEEIVEGGWSSALQVHNHGDGSDYRSQLGTVVSMVGVVWCDPLHHTTLTIETTGNNAVCLCSKIAR